MNQPIRNTPPTPRRGGGAKPLAVLGAVLFVAVALYASRPSLPPAPVVAVAGAEEPPTPTARAVAAANKFLDALEAKQRDKASYEFGSPKKPGWSNLPVTMVPRNGVRMGDLTKEQRTLAMDVVASVLSKGGYQKVVDIVGGDQKLAEGGGGRGGRGGKPGGKPGGAMFGADQYYLAVFGKPSEKDPWMVQFGGHHLGINVTVVGKHFVLTPTHTGAQPSLYKRDGKEVRPLGTENDSGFKLVNALDEKQRKKAVVGDRAQGELVLGPQRDDRSPPAPEGIKGSDLTDKQQAMLLDLIGAWVNIAEPDAARARMEEIKKTVGETYFSWRGPTTEGSAVYFRVQGPTIWIEYAPQGGTDHIHTVVRNPKDDYGTAEIKR
ncbi:MAG TPA: DUF3500 domain-containing protein [Gemmataceae bacterium]|nr:DUF3500 domain-containing protein [Gemmataceae bacterium]